MKTTLIICLFFCGPSAFNQNLFPNPGFEEVTGCPGATIYLKNTKYWHGIPNHYGTPDQFYGDCGYNGIQNSMAPNQKPYDGVGYVGSFCYGSNLREYITVELSEPMLKDSLYQIEFFVMPANGYGTMINSYGVHFSLEEPMGVDPKSLAPIHLEEHVGNPADRMLVERASWTSISGTYKAKGGERFATFGNFKSDDATIGEVHIEDCIRADRSYILFDGATLRFANEEIESSDLTMASSFYEQRDLKEKASYITEKKSVKITFWDHQKVDGDTVIIVLNDSVLLHNFPITKKKEKLEIDLEPGEYYLKVIAVNLGEVPPNTCTIKISDGKHRRTFVLNSNMKKTEYLKIVVRP